MSNPYAEYFARLDVLVPQLESHELSEEGMTELADLCRRAAYVLAVQLNANAQVLPTLILPVEAESVAEVEDETPSNPATGST